MDAIADRTDHRAVIAGLSPERRRLLTTRRDGPGLAHAALHLGLIGLLGGLVSAGVAFWPLLLLPLGVLIVFLFTALHETSHDTAFATPWMNRALGHVAGFLVLNPPLWFRYFHFAHHRHTHDPEHDPELASPKPATVAQYAWYLTGLPLWYGLVAGLVGRALGGDPGTYVPDRAQGRVRREAQLYLALYVLLAAASVALNSAVLLWVWIVPALLGQPFLRAYLLAEHALCPHVANMLANTRTTFTNGAIRWLAWNMPYHAEHHAYPAVPFHRLPDFHADTRDHLQVTAKGYVAFHHAFAASLEMQEQHRDAD